MIFLRSFLRVTKRLLTLALVIAFAFVVAFSFAATLTLCWAGAHIQVFTRDQPLAWGFEPRAGEGKLAYRRKNRALRKLSYRDLNPSTQNALPVLYHKTSPQEEIFSPEESEAWSASDIIKSYVQNFWEMSDDYIWTIFMVLSSKFCWELTKHVLLYFC